MYLTTLDLSRYTTLGSADYPAYTLYNNIAEVIRQRISPEAAQILAEPSFDDSSQEIDYIFSGEGDARKLDSLADTEKNLVLDKLTAYSKEIQALADSYLKTQDSQTKRIGQNLHHSLYIPDISSVYVIHGNPVLTGWGLQERDGREPFNISHSGRLKVGIINPVTAPLAPKPENKPESRQKSSTFSDIQQDHYKTRDEGVFGIPWLNILLILLALLLLLLLLAWLFSPDKPSATSSSPPSVVKTNENKTHERGGGQNKNISHEIAEPDPLAQPKSKIAQKGGESLDTHVGGVSSKTPAGKDQMSGFTSPKASMNLPSNPAPTQLDQWPDLVIPKTAIESRDMGFLNGDWISITDLLSALSKEPLQINYSFNQQGFGTTTVTRENGGQCTAPVRAEFKQDQSLYIQDQDDVDCEDGVYFPKSVVICEVDDKGKAVCRGKQIDNEFEVTLKRSGNSWSTVEQLERELMGLSVENSSNLTSNLSSATIRNSIPKYRRDYFGKGWADQDDDCQNTRQEVLISLSTIKVAYRHNRNCHVSHGKWISPFTSIVYFNPSELDIDHVVPLKWAWTHGASEWHTQLRETFANDPINLFPVEANLNSQKGASGLEWLPPENQCSYIARFMRIVKKYGLNFSSSESVYSQSLLKECKQ